MCEAILSKQSPFTDLDNQVKENASHDTVQLILVLQFIYMAHYEINLIIN